MTKDLDFGCLGLISKRPNEILKQHTILYCHSNLTINEFDFFHRSANKMIVHPIDKLSGQLVSTGDVISVNRPDIVEVETLFTGQLIFE